MNAWLRGAISLNICWYLGTTCISIYGGLQCILVYIILKIQSTRSYVGIHGRCLNLLHNKGWTTEYTDQSMFHCSASLQLSCWPIHQVVVLHPLCWGTCPWPPSCTALCWWSNKAAYLRPIFYAVHPYMMLLRRPSTKLCAPTLVNCVYVPINADDTDTHRASLNLAISNTSQSAVPMMRVQRRILFTYQLQANAVSTIDAKTSEINGHAHSTNNTLLWCRHH